MKEGKAETKSYLVEVTPVNNSSATRSLSYFSATKLALGTLVKVPLRNGFSLALVLSCRDVQTAKTEIRRAGFQLKKIRKSDILEASLPPQTLEALQECALHYALSVGNLVSALLPKAFSNEPEIFLKTGEKKRKLPEHLKETLLLQMENEERFGQYRALVRQAFAHGSSVLFVVPTHLDIKRVEAELSKGIADFVYTFSLNMKAETLTKTWLKAMDEKHPVLFITTPAGIFFHRPDCDTIIVERENSRAYRTFNRPFLNLKTLIETIAKRSHQQLVFGDSVLSLETLWKERSGEYGENSLIRWRLPSAPTSLIDASSKQNEHGHFEILSKEVKEMIQKALDEKEGVFLFGARKGLAPTTVCGDCGFVLPCLNCGAPVVLHQHHNTTIYVCHACRERRDSTTTCGYCGSWKLVPLGIGTEQIAREVRGLFPHVHVEILDKDHASTDKQAQAVVQNFKEKGGVLIGTELAFYHLESVLYSALVSVDALFSVPDFSINERIFYLVSRLRELSKSEILIQSRNIGKQVLSWATQGNIIDFYQNEIAEREMLLYPPFSIFIKITADKKLGTGELLKLKERLEPWKPDVLQDSLVLRIPRANWPESELTSILSLLGPQFSIKVDPESIL